MHPRTVQAIRAVLPRGRTLFHYFKDRHAVERLRELIGDGVRVSEIKRSPFAPLLRKPCVKSVCANLRGDLLTANDLLRCWPQRPLAYVLTLGEWGDPEDWDREYHQTTRRGSNLVLQLNFTNEHDAVYREVCAGAREAEDVLGQWPEGVYNNCGHPVNEQGRLTLAWARLDIDLRRGEALIEEIQCDWLREAFSDARQIDSRKLRVPEPSYLPLWWGQPEVHAYHRYVDRVLRQHLPTWNEAMLWAALWFLRTEIGIDRIFYHSLETCRHLKGFRHDWDLPPRSLYTKLPRSFCMQRTRRGPAFLTDAARRDNFLRCKLKNHEFEWFVYEPQTLRSTTSRRQPR